MQPLRCAFALRTSNAATADLSRRPVSIPNTNRAVRIAVFRVSLSAFGRFGIVAIETEQRRRHGNERTMVRLEQAPH